MKRRTKLGPAGMAGEPYSLACQRLARDPRGLLSDARPSTGRCRRGAASLRPDRCPQLQPSPRRAGAKPEPPEEAPDINIGTFSMPRDDWAFLLDPLYRGDARLRFQWPRLDVRETSPSRARAKQTRFVHRALPRPRSAPSRSSSRNSSWTNGPASRSEGARSDAWLYRACRPRPRQTPAVVSRPGLSCPRPSQFALGREVRAAPSGSKSAKPAACTLDALSPLPHSSIAASKSLGASPAASPLHSSATLAWDRGTMADTALRAIVERCSRSRPGPDRLALYDRAGACAAKGGRPASRPFVGARSERSDERCSADCAENSARRWRRSRSIFAHCRVETAPGPTRAERRNRGRRVRPIPRSSRWACPSVHLSHGRATFIRRCLRDMSVRDGDALLKSPAASPIEPARRRRAHYRALAEAPFSLRRSPTEARRGSPSSFDFLLSVSPINTAEARNRLPRRSAIMAPRFRYRPLRSTWMPPKRRLYNIDLAQLEDPLLESSVRREKARDRAAAEPCLARVTRPILRAASMLQYGAVDPAPAGRCRGDPEMRSCAQARQEVIGASEVAHAAKPHRVVPGDGPPSTPRWNCARTCRRLYGLRWTLMVSTHTRMADHRVGALLAHEVSVHCSPISTAAPRASASSAPGLAKYEGVQEGLGVFAEWAVGGLTAGRGLPARGRVAAVDAMPRGATSSEGSACSRIRGFRDETGFLDRGSSLSLRRLSPRTPSTCEASRRCAIWSLAGTRSTPSGWARSRRRQDLPAIEELLQRGLVHPPTFLPSYLNRPEAKSRIARLTSDIGLDRLFEMESA